MGATKKMPRHASADSGSQHSDLCVSGMDLAVQDRAYKVYKQPALVLHIPAGVLDHVADLREYVRKLHRIQLRGELSQLGDEGISERLVDLILAGRPTGAQQVGHADLQRGRQPGE